MRQKLAASAESGTEALLSLAELLGQWEWEAPDGLGKRVV